MNLDGKNSLWRWRRIDVITLSVVVCFIVAGSIGQEMHGQKRVVGDNFQPVIASLMPVLVQDTLPATAYAMIGDQITFSAGFQNFSGAVFQWQKISNGTVWDIPGATNMTLTLTNLQLADAAAYWLEAVNASDHALIAHSSARPLTVDRLPPAVNNVITVVAAQTGLGGATTFIPTWVVTTNNNLIAGQLPSNCSGDFSLESPGRSVGCLTLSNNGALTVIKIGLNRTSSTNYVTCGNGNWAGSSITYQLNGSRTGYDLTNITVYGGWADGNRNQQAYTVYYSTVMSPTTFIRLGSVNFNPSDPANAQSASRVTLLPATGALAMNVGMVKFDFSNPASKNGHSGYSQIIISGAVSAKPPALEYPVDSLASKGTKEGHTLNPLDLLGSWIWDSKTYSAQTCQFWRAFDVPLNSKVTAARLLATADNEFILYLDGRELGRGGEWRELFDYNLTALINPGQHVLAVKAFNSAGTAGLIIGLRVDLADGRFIEIKSDSDWKIVSNETKNWEVMAKAHGDWTAATVVAAMGNVPWWSRPSNINPMLTPQPIKVFFWQTSQFQISFFTLFGLVLVVVIFLLAQLALHQKERWLLQRERARIAMDVHDDIGSRITQLVLAGEVTKQELPQNSKARVQLGEICDDARKVLSSIDEILWALNPRLDTLRDFADYICDYTHKYLEPAAIKCVFEIDPKMQMTPADLPLRRSLLMAIKEILNNTVKYSGATELRLKIERQHQHLAVVVVDNGKGFAPDAVKPGRSGLGNLSKRMRELGGSCHISSRPGKGCRIELIIPLKRPRKFWAPFK